MHYCRYVIDVDTRSFFAQSHLAKHCYDGEKRAILNTTMQTAAALEKTRTLDIVRYENADAAMILPFSVTKRIPVLDGLRGIAIALVLLYHLETLLVNMNHGALRYAVIAGRLTWSGVDLFFVLSGFLIGGILLDAVRSPRYYSTFYKRRAFRIFAHLRNRLDAYGHSIRAF